MNWFLFFYEFKHIPALTRNRWVAHVSNHCFYERQAASDYDMKYGHGHQFCQMENAKTCIAIFSSRQHNYHK